MSLHNPSKLQIAKLVQVFIFCLLWSGQSAHSQESYIWHDENSVRHISTHPESCIDKEKRVLKVECSINPSMNWVSSNQIDATYHEESEKECSEHGVYVGDTPGLEFANNLPSGNVISAMLNLRILQQLKFFDDMAKSECRDIKVYLTNSDQVRRVQEYRKARRSDRETRRSERNFKELKNDVRNVDRNMNDIARELEELRKDMNDDRMSN